MTNPTNYPRNEDYIAWHNAHVRDDGVDVIGEDIARCQREDGQCRPPRCVGCPIEEPW